ncbi:MAG: ATP-binding protein, partial [Proteobacteria bacterium]
TQLAPDARLFAKLDIDAFGIVVRNLIENADKHGTTGGPIVISVGNNMLEVTSAGPVLPPDQLAMLGRRFERGSTTAPGSGLGLAIAESIMRQIGGRLELQSPGIDRNDGFTARIVA